MLFGFNNTLKITLRIQSAGTVMLDVNLLKVMLSCNCHVKYQFRVFVFYMYFCATARTFWYGSYMSDWTRGTVVMQLNVARLIKSVVCNGTPEVHSRVYQSPPLIPFLIHITSTPLHLLSLISFNNILPFLWCTQVCCVQINVLYSMDIFTGQRFS